MKMCSQCGIKKDVSEFHKHKRKADGLNNICKVCKKKNYYLVADRERARRRKNYRENREKELENNRRWQRENRTESREANKRWRDENPEKMKASKRNWLKNNLAKNAASAMLYHTSKKNRTPPWLTKEHLKQIEEFYVLSAKLTKETGVRYSVDHIMPLQGKTSSGLHVPWNLQVITMSENSSKGNKLCY